MLWIKRSEGKENENISLQPDLFCVWVECKLCNLIPSFLHLHSSSLFRFLSRRCNLRDTSQGFELFVPGDDAVTVWRTLTAESEVRLAALGARDALRLEAGACDYVWCCC